MPKIHNQGKSQERLAVNLPKTIVDEVDRLTKLFAEYHWNRQQFVENAVRDTILKFQQIEASRTLKKNEVTHLQSIQAINSNSEALTQAVNKLEEHLAKKKQKKGER